MAQRSYYETQAMRNGTKARIDMGKAVALYRVSTDGQENGLEVQRRECVKWAEVNRVQIVTEYTEHISGKTPIAGRPLLIKAVNDVESLGAGHLLVYKRDRLTRDTFVAIAIERILAVGGARVTCANGEGSGDLPGDVMIRRIMDAVAEHERALLSMRITQALAIVKEEGRLDGARFMALTPRTVERVYELMQIDGMGYEEMCRTLRYEGHRSTAGTEITRVSMRKVIEKIRVVGIEKMLREAQYLWWRRKVTVGATDEDLAHGHATLIDPHSIDWNAPRLAENIVRDPVRYHDTRKPKSVPDATAVSILLGGSSPFSHGDQ